MGDFGNKFRKARESKKLSLEDVSNVTKISSRMLKAIEEENFDQLPGGVFNKGFIRAYAKQVGLNPEDAVADYLTCMQQIGIDSRKAWDFENQNNGSAPAKTLAKSSKGPAPPQASVAVEEELPNLQLPRAEHIRSKPKEYLDRPSRGTPWLTIAVVLVIVLSAALFWVRRSRHQHSTETIPATPAMQISSTGQATPETIALRSSSGTSAPSPAAAANPLPSTSKPQTGARPAASATSTQPAIPKNEDASVPAATPSPKAQAALTLIIRASENSWISVSSDGQLVTQETLIAPAHTTVHGNHEIVVRIGNAGGVTFSWKGEELPAQGAEGEVKTLIFDADGLHSPPAVPPN